MVGYESSLLILNMGTLFIILVFFLTLPICLFLTNPLKIKSKWFKTKSESVSSSLKGNLFIRFFLEGCLDISIAIMLNTIKI